MSKFRIPRKTKKKIKGFYLYPSDEKGNSLMAFPKRNQEDFNYYKSGAKSLFDKRLNKTSKKEPYRFDKEIYIGDDTLLEYVKDIIRKDLVNSSYNLLIRAKQQKRSKKAYFNFINAYQAGNYENICCMSIDLAEDLLRRKDPEL